MSENCITSSDPKEDVIQQVFDHKFNTMTYPIAVAYYSQSMDFSEVTVALCWGVVICFVLIVIERISCMFIGAKPKKV